MMQDYQITTNQSIINSTLPQNSLVLNFHAKLIIYIGAAFSIGLSIITLSILIWIISRQKKVTFEQVPTEAGNPNEGSNTNHKIYDDFSYLNAQVRNKDKNISENYDNRIQLASVVYEAPTICREQVTHRQNSVTDNADIYCNTLQYRSTEKKHQNEIYINMNTNR